MGCGRTGTRSETARRTALPKRTVARRGESKKRVRGENASGRQRGGIKKASSRGSRAEGCKRNHGAESLLRAGTTEVAPGTRRCNAACAHNRATNEEGTRVHYFQRWLIRRRCLQDWPNAASRATRSC